jgi:3-isopropylmalate dehydrogenase
MAQAAHGSAPDIAGKGVANPTGIMLSTAQLMRWLADRHEDPQALRAGERIEAAVAGAIEAGIRTRDLGGTAGTEEFTAAVVERV